MVHVAWHRKCSKINCMKRLKCVLILVVFMATAFVCIGYVQAQDESFRPFTGGGTVAGMIVGHRIVRTTEKPEYFVKLETDEGVLFVPITREAYAVTSISIGLNAEFELSDNGYLLDFYILSPAP